MHSKHKKIAAVFIFALCGFLGGWASQAHAQDAPYGSCPDNTNTYCGDFSLYGYGGSQSQIYYHKVWSGSATYKVILRHVITVDPWNVPDVCLWDNTQSHGTNVYIDSCAGTLADGYYLFMENQSGGTGNSYAQYFQIIGGITYPYNPWGPTSDATTQFTSITPNSTIASSSPITVTINYNLNTTDYASSTAAGQTIRLLSRVSGRDTNFVSETHTQTISSAGGGTFSFQVPTDLPAGQFSTYVSITSYNGSPTFDCSALATGGTCVPIGGINVASTTNWTLNSSYFENITGTTTPNNLVYKNAPCGISDLSGCFQNALAALFYPTIAPGQAFQSIKDTAQAKFPIVYVTQLGAIRTALLSASSTAATSVSVNLWKLGSSATTTINLISQTAIANVPYTGTIYTVLTWLIWLMMAEYIYYRVLRMHDTHTP